jgi:hypothetical protein
MPSYESLDIVLKYEDLRKALPKIKPSAIRDVSLEVPKVHGFLTRIFYKFVRHNSVYGILFVTICVLHRFLGVVV